MEATLTSLFLNASDGILDNPITKQLNEPEKEVRIEERSKKGEIESEIQVLRNYGAIKTMIEGLEQRVLRVAVESSCFNGVCFDAMYYCEKVIALKTRISALRALADAIEALVHMLPYKYRLALKYRALKGFSVNGTAEILGVQLRSAFRIIGTAEERFCSMCRQKADYSELFTSVLRHEGWLKRCVRSN